MSVSEKQTVEIVKVLYRGADILILDEPTAVLTPQETDKLFAVLRNMRDDGKSVVIITHKLHEVEDLSDRVAILRRGQFVGDMLTKNTNAAEMTNMMVGRPVSLNIDARSPRTRSRGWWSRTSPSATRTACSSSTACPSRRTPARYWGVAGISGCGQKELLEAIAGLHRAEGGSISYIDPRDPARMRSSSARTPRTSATWAWPSPSSPRTGWAWASWGTWTSQTT